MDAGLQGRRGRISGQSRRCAALFGGTQKRIDQRVHLKIDVLRRRRVRRISRGRCQRESRRCGVHRVVGNGRNGRIKRNRVGRRGRNHRYVAAELISNIDFIGDRIDRDGNGKCASGDSCCRIVRPVNHRYVVAVEISDIDFIRRWINRDSKGKCIRRATSLHPSRVARPGTPALPASVVNSFCHDPKRIVPT